MIFAILFLYGGIQRLQKQCKPPPIEPGVREISRKTTQPISILLRQKKYVLSDLGQTFYACEWPMLHELTSKLVGDEFRNWKEITKLRASVAGVDGSSIFNYSFLVLLSE